MFGSHNSKSSPFPLIHIKIQHGSFGTRFSYTFRIQIIFTVYTIEKHWRHTLKYVKKVKVKKDIQPTVN